jgi:hypothetical protein
VCATCGVGGCRRDQTASFHRSETIERAVDVVAADESLLERCRDDPSGLAVAGCPACSVYHRSSVYRAWRRRRGEHVSTRQASRAMHTYARWWPVGSPVRGQNDVYRVAFESPQPVQFECRDATEWGRTAGADGQRCDPEPLLAGNRTEPRDEHRAVWTLPALGVELMADRRLAHERERLLDGEDAALPVQQEVEFAQAVEVWHLIECGHPRGGCHQRTWSCG